MYRFRGDSRRLTHAEVNRWNKTAQRDQFGQLRSRGQAPTIRSYDPSSRVVWAQNTSGADRSRFDTLSIDPTDCLLWELEANGEFDLAFKLAAADPELAAAILVDPIENNGFGRAVIHGPAIAKVEISGSSDYRFANAQTSTNTLLPAPAGPIKLLAAPSESAAVFVPVLIGAGPNMATIVAGLVNADFSSAPATFAVKTLVGINGTTPAGPTLTVANRFGWDAGSVDAPILILWDPDQAEWIPFQMECPA